ncbi:MAG TPA: hypothetical protein VHR66_28355 [Gemmataceae bacterium]|jgi:hypothetical protein|nr:hypothetical protein [Gemmataceae bacterium]
MPRSLSLAILLLGAATVSTCPPPSDEIEVKVLAILASEHNKEVNPKLTEFAKQVQKKEPSLTGFKLDRTNGEKLKLGETKKFLLTGNEVVEVTVNKERNEQGRITLTIKPPKMNQITYECACDKFFSMATDHFEGKGKEKTQLFIAIMAKPCGAAKK